MSYYMKNRVLLKIAHDKYYNKSGKEKEAKYY